MRSTTIRILVEAAQKKVFLSALDWPGWSRGTKTEEPPSRPCWPWRPDT